MVDPIRLIDLESELMGCARRLAWELWENIFPTENHGRYTPDNAVSYAC